MHPPKGNADAVTAAIGSTAWTAVPRMAWVMSFDKTDDDKQRRVVRPAPGSNYRLPEHGLSFRIAQHDETEAGFVTALVASDVSVEDIMAPPEGEPPEEMSKLDAAREFVRRVVAVDMATGVVRSRRGEGGSGEGRYLGPDPATSDEARGRQVDPTRHGRCGRLAMGASRPAIWPKWR